MKAAFVVWQERIAPVFDTARQAVIVTMDEGGRAMTRMEPLTGPTPGHDLMRLRDMGVDTLVCGAMSRPMQQAAAACGLRVIPFVAGETQAMISAWQQGRLEHGRFAMPGCRGRRQRRKRRRRD